MKNAARLAGVFVGCVTLLGASGAGAQDWPQWRGPNRDAKVTGFKVPQTWPRELTQKWKVAVGNGVATPALVGDRLYVFSRQEADEVIRCLDAATGKDVWQEKYATEGAAGPASRFPGPRSSPTVSGGKVVTLGVRGILSCLDAATGTKLWRKADFSGSLPMFFTSSSPLVVDGLCIVQLGGERNGATVAYDLATGDEKWKWTGDGSAYASPVLQTAGGAPVLIAETARNVVGLSVAEGKLLWQTPFVVQGRGYNASTPIVEGPTLIYSGSGRGTRAVQIDKQGDEHVVRELWHNAENSVQYNTPVVKNGLVFGLTDRDSLFCLNARTGQTAWTKPISGRRGYGSIVDAGSILLALTPESQLIAFEPSDKEYKELASYKVADEETYAYPVISGNRVFVKDQSSVTLWTIE